MYEIMFISSGAVSTARFMGRALYFMKIEMTKRQVPEDVISDDEKQQVARISKFTFFLYAKYFLQAMVPAAAPRYDLQFWEDTHQFQLCDPELVDAVFTSIYRHMWYLSEELIPLALCDDGTTDKEKENIVQAMLTAGRPQTFQPKKPDMKSNLLQGRAPGLPSLSEFVGPRSWIIFTMLDVNVAWMEHPPSQWEECNEFLRFQHLIKSLKVVNDCAERAVKDMTEFLNYCQDAERREHVVMVVSHHRQIINYKRLTKADMDNMNMFI